MTRDDLEAEPAACLCSHPEPHHWGNGECMHPACGCGSYRTGSLPVAQRDDDRKSA